MLFGLFPGSPAAMRPDPLRADDDSDQVASSGPVGPYSVLKARYDRLQQIGLRVQNACDDIAAQLERVQVGESRWLHSGKGFMKHHRLLGLSHVGSPLELQYERRTYVKNAV